MNVKSDFLHLFLLILLLSPLPVMGNFQIASALTPVADLTGQWSGFAQLANVEGICEFSGKVNANIKQDGNTIVGGYSFVTTNVKTNDPDNMGFECQNIDYQENFRGTLDGSRITLNSDGGGVFTGWYASSGIKLDLQSDELVGTAQLSPTNFTPPAFGPKDTDGDGMPDSSDSCPTQPETLNGYQDTDGCPEKDTDNDSFYDDEDECVTLPEDYYGENITDGCPEETTKIPEKTSEVEKSTQNDQSAELDKEAKIAVENELKGAIDAMTNEIKPEDWAGVPIEGDTPELLRGEDDENDIVPTPNWAEGGDEGGPIIQKTDKELVWDKLLNTLDENHGKISRNKGTETIIDSDGNVVRSDVFKIGQKIKTGNDQGTNIQIDIGDGTMNLAKNTEVIQMGLELSPDDLSDEKSLMTAITEKLDSLNDKELDAVYATSLFTGLSLGTVIGTATIGGPVVVPSALIISGFAVLVGGAYFETYPEDIPFKTNQISEIFSAYALDENIQRVIFTPHAVLFPHGTKFLVEVTDEETKLDVMEGEVSVVPLNTNNPVTTVKAGNSISISDKQIEQAMLNTTIDEWWKISAPSQPTSQPPPQKSGGCLIATAAYGTELAPQVQKLREIRDSKLLQTESGSTFMNSFNNFYYSFSPAVADYERENPVFKELVKITLTPMISSLSILNYVDMDSESSVLGYGISLIILNLGMYFVAPIAVIHIIRKKL